MTKIMNVKVVLMMAALIGAFGTQVSGLESWGEMATPSFVGGTLIYIGTSVTALFVEKPV